MHKNYNFMTNNVPRVLVVEVDDRNADILGVDLAFKKTYEACDVVWITDKSICFLARASRMVRQFNLLAITRIMSGSLQSNALSRS
jgi:hypothetical protein